MGMNDEEKKENATQWLIMEAQSGDESAKEMLLEMHQGIIWLLAKRFRCEWVTCEELAQAGYLGFMRALARYDTSKNAKLITYALPWILGEMRREMRQREAAAYSLDEPLDGECLTLHDILEGETGMSIDRIDLHLALDRLNRDERHILFLRYFRDKTQKESALIMGKSQTQISRLERMALNSMYVMLS